MKDRECACSRGTQKAQEPPADGAPGNMTLEQSSRPRAVGERARQGRSARVPHGFVFTKDPAAASLLDAKGICRP